MPGRPTAACAWGGHGADERGVPERTVGRSLHAHLRRGLWDGRHDEALAAAPPLRAGHEARLDGGAAHGDVAHPAATRAGDALQRRKQARASSSMARHTGAWSHLPDPHSSVRVCDGDPLYEDVRDVPVVPLRAGGGHRGGSLARSPPPCSARGTHLEEVLYLDGGGRGGQGAVQDPHATQRRDGRGPRRAQRVAVARPHGDAVVARGDVEALQRDVGAALYVYAVAVGPGPGRHDAQAAHDGVRRAPQQRRPVGAVQKLEAV